MLGASEPQTVVTSSVMACSLPDWDSGLLLGKHVCVGNDQDFCNFLCGFSRRIWKHLGANWVDRLHHGIIQFFWRYEAGNKLAVQGVGSQRAGNAKTHLPFTTEALLTQAHLLMCKAEQNQNLQCLASTWLGRVGKIRAQAKQVKESNYLIPSLNVSQLGPFHRALTRAQQARLSLGSPILASCSGRLNLLKANAEPPPLPLVPCGATMWWLMSKACYSHRSPDAISFCGGFAMRFQ